MYHVTFQYDTASTDFPYYHNVRVTTAKVFGPNNDLVTTGFAVCAPEDQFKKATGRKIALTRALESFDRPMRRAVWRAVLAKGMRVR